MTLDTTTIALVCLVLLAAGYAVVLAVSLVPRLAPTADEILAILHTEAVIVVTVVSAFWIGGWVLTLGLVAFTLRVGYEATSVIFGRIGASRRQVAAASLVLAASALIAAMLPLQYLLLLGLAGLGLCWLIVARTPAEPVSIGDAAILLAAFPGIPLALFVAAAQQGLGAWLLAAFFLVETFDSYALLGGRLFGRTAAFPRLSPRKTVEGLAAGAVMLMLTAAAVGYLLIDAPVPASAAFALFTGVLTVAGDLAASRLKRLSGVKDFPPIIASQGGLLDITDAWIAAGAGVAAFAVLAGLA